MTQEQNAQCLNAILTLVNRAPINGAEAENVVELKRWLIGVVGALKYESPTVEN